MWRTFKVRLLLRFEKAGYKLQVGVAYQSNVNARVILCTPLSHYDVPRNAMLAPI